MALEAGSRIATELPDLVRLTGVADAGRETIDTVEGVRRRVRPQAVMVMTGDVQATVEEIENGSGETNGPKEERNGRRVAVTGVGHHVVTTGGT